VQDVLADLEAEDLKLGLDALGQVKVAELAGRDEISHAVRRLGAGACEQVEGGRPVPGRVGLPGEDADPGKQVTPGGARRGRGIGRHPAVAAVERPGFWPLVRPAGRWWIVARAGARPTIHYDGPKVGGGGVEGVEGADEDQALRHRAGDPGAVPEVAQAGVGLAGDNPGDLGVADALDLAE
jgi:hypothetical protein